MKSAIVLPAGIPRLPSTKSGCWEWFDMTQGKIFLKFQNPGKAVFLPNSLYVFFSEAVSLVTVSFSIRQLASMICY